MGDLNLDEVPEALECAANIKACLEDSGEDSSEDGGEDSSEDGGDEEMPSFTMCDVALFPRFEDYERVSQNCSSVFQESSPNSPEGLLCIATAMNFMDNGVFNATRFVQYFSQRIQENDSDLTPRQRKRMIKKLSGKCSRRMDLNLDEVPEALECAANIKACREDSGEDSSEDGGEDSSEDGAEEEDYEPSRCELALLPPSEDMNRIYEKCASLFTQDSPVISEALLCVATELQFMDGEELNEDRLIEYATQRIQENKSGLRRGQKKRLVKRLTGKCRNILQGNVENVLEFLECAVDIKACRSQQRG